MDFSLSSTLVEDPFGLIAQRDATSSALSIVKRQAEGAQFVDVTQADPHTTFEFILGPENHNFWAITNFFSNLFRTLGFLAWGQIYNLALASSTGVYRESLESLDFFFNSQVILNGFFYNLTGWFIYVIGRLAIDLYVYGPSYTFDKIRNSESVFDALERVTGLTNTGINVWVYVVECTSVMLGWIVLMAVRQYFLGVNSNKRRRRHATAFSNSNEADDILQAIDSFGAKIDTFSS